MPFWTYFYLALAFAGSTYVVYLNRSRPFYYFLGELLSLSMIIGMFLLAFNVVELTHTKILATSSLIYLLYWGLWANRHHYTVFTQSAAEFAETVELGEDETLEDAVLAIKIIKSTGIAVTVLLCLPFLFVYLKVMGIGT